MMFSTLVRYRAVPTLLACAALSGSACAPGVAAPGAKKGAQSSAPPPPSGGGVGQDITLTLPDPKFPGANKLLYYLRAGAADVQLNPDGSFQGGLTKLWVRLYQKGLPTAVLTAPRAKGGGTSRAFVLTGQSGVVVKSLTEPGTVITADTVVWRSALDSVVATGHVFYHDGKSGTTYRGPYLQGDTKLNHIKTHSGHMTGTF